ncbi:hypothetical protein FRX31_009191, partial [Thalictrum thalictroides]
MDNKINQVETHVETLSQELHDFVKIQGKPPIEEPIPISSTNPPTLLFPNPTTQSSSLSFPPPTSQTLPSSLSQTSSFENPNFHHTPHSHMPSFSTTPIYPKTTTQFSTPPPQPTPTMFTTTKPFPGPSFPPPPISYSGYSTLPNSYSQNSQPLMSHASYSNPNLLIQQPPSFSSQPRQPNHPTFEDDSSKFPPHKGNFHRQP